MVKERERRAEREGGYYWVRLLGISPDQAANLSRESKKQIINNHVVTFVVLGTDVDGPLQKAVDEHNIHNDFNILVHYNTETGAVSVTSLNRDMILANGNNFNFMLADQYEYQPLVNGDGQNGFVPVTNPVEKAKIRYEWMTGRPIDSVNIFGFRSFESFIDGLYPKGMTFTSMANLYEGRQSQEGTIANDINRQQTWYQGRVYSNVKGKDVLRYVRNRSDSSFARDMRAIQIIGQIFGDQAISMSTEGGLNGRIGAISGIMSMLNASDNFATDTPWFGKTADGQSTGLLAHMAYRNNIAQAYRNATYLRKLSEAPGLLSKLTINVILPENTDNNYEQSLDKLLSFNKLPIKTHRILSYAGNISNAPSWFKNKVAFSDWVESFGEFNYRRDDVARVIRYYQPFRKLLQESAYGKEEIKLSYATPTSIPPTATSQPTKTATLQPTPQPTVTVKPTGVVQTEEQRIVSIRTAFEKSSGIAEFTFAPLHDAVVRSRIDRVTVNDPKVTGYDSKKPIVTRENVKSFWSRILGKESPTDVEIDAVKDAVINSPIVALSILSSDARVGESISDARNDFTFIVLFNTKTGEIDFVSLPRDFRWADGNPVNTTVHVSDAVVALGGSNFRSVDSGDPIINTTVRMEMALGIPMDIVNIITFDSFISIFDKLFPEGLDVYVYRDIHDSGYPTSDFGVKTVDFKQGWERMKAERVLEYVRTRHDGSDKERNFRTSEVFVHMISNLMGIVIRDGSFYRILNRMTDASIEVQSNPSLFLSNVRWDLVLRDMMYREYIVRSDRSLNSKYGVELGKQAGLYAKSTADLVNSYLNLGKLNKGNLIGIHLVGATNGGAYVTEPVLERGDDCSLCSPGYINCSQRYFSGKETDSGNIIPSVRYYAFLRDPKLGLIPKSVGMDWRNRVVISDIKSVSQDTNTEPQGSQRVIQHSVAPDGTTIKPASEKNKVFKIYQNFQGQNSRFLFNGKPILVIGDSNSARGVGTYADILKLDVFSMPGAGASAMADEIESDADFQAHINNYGAVLVWEGVNAPWTGVGGLERIYKQMHAKGIKVIGVTQFVPDGADAATKDYIRATNTFIKNNADYAIPFADIATKSTDSWTNRLISSKDKIHLTAEGHDRFAGVVSDFLARFSNQGKAPNVQPERGFVIPALGFVTDFLRRIADRSRSTITNQPTVPTEANNVALGQNGKEVSGPMLYLSGVEKDRRVLNRFVSRTSQINRAVQYFIFRNISYRKEMAVIDKVNNLESLYRGKSKVELQKAFQKIRDLGKDGNLSGENFVNTLAMLREITFQTTGIRLHDVQLLAAIITYQKPQGHKGIIAELATGEGKTYAAAIAAILNSVTEQGKGIYLLSTEDHLAMKDLNVTGSIYNALGLSVSILQDSGVAYTFSSNPASPLMSFSRREAHSSDVVLGTMSQLAFDINTTNRALSLDQKLITKPFGVLLIDEIDEALVRKAHTPFVNAEEGIKADPEFYYKINSYVLEMLTKSELYFVDGQAVHLTDQGYEYFRTIGFPLRPDPRPGEEYGVVDDFSSEFFAREEAVKNALFVQTIWKTSGAKDTYFADDAKRIIVPLSGGVPNSASKFSNGLQEALEAKHRYPISDNRYTSIAITTQQVIALFPKVSGFTATVGSQNQADVFWKSYGLGVRRMPKNIEYLAFQPNGNAALSEVQSVTNGVPVTTYVKRSDPSIILAYKRIDYPDVIVGPVWQQIHKVFGDILATHETGRPILVDVSSVEESQRYAEMLQAHNIRYTIQGMLVVRALMQKYHVSDARNIKELNELFDNQGFVRPDVMSRISQENGLDLAFERQNFERVATLLGVSSAYLQDVLTNGIFSGQLSAENVKEQNSTVQNAGRKGMVTFSTFLGRGVDINLPYIDPQVEQSVLRLFVTIGVVSDKLAPEEIIEKLQSLLDSAKVRAQDIDAVEKYIQYINQKKELRILGGLHVVGTYRNEFETGDNQLRGRAARQGDPGSSIFYLSVEREISKRKPEDQTRILRGSSSHWKREVDDSQMSRGNQILSSVQSTAEFEDTIQMTNRIREYAGFRDQIMSSHDIKTLVRPMVALALETGMMREDEAVTARSTLELMDEKQIQEKILSFANAAWAQYLGDLQEVQRSTALEAGALRVDRKTLERSKSSDAYLSMRRSIEIRVAKWLLDQSEENEKTLQATPNVDLANLDMKPSSGPQGSSPFSLSGRFVDRIARSSTDVLRRYMSSTLVASAVQWGQERLVRPVMDVLRRRMGCGETAFHIFPLAFAKTGDGCQLSPGTVRAMDTVEHIMDTVIKHPVAILVPSDTDPDVLMRSALDANGMYDVPVSSVKYTHILAGKTRWNNKRIIFIRGRDGEVSVIDAITLKKTPFDTYMSQMPPGDMLTWGSGQEVGYAKGADGRFTKALILSERGTYRAEPIVETVVDPEMLWDALQSAVNVSTVDAIMGILEQDPALAAYARQLELKEYIQRSVTAYVERAEDDRFLRADERVLLRIFSRFPKEAKDTLMGYIGGLVSTGKSSRGFSGLAKLILSDAFAGYMGQKQPTAQELAETIGQIEEIAGVSALDIMHTLFSLSGTAEGTGGGAGDEQVVKLKRSIHAIRSVVTKPADGKYSYPTKFQRGVIIGDNIVHEGDPTRDHNGKPYSVNSDTGYPNSIDPAVMITVPKKASRDEIERARRVLEKLMVIGHAPTLGDASTSNLVGQDKAVSLLSNMIQYGLWPEYETPSLARYQSAPWIGGFGK